MFIHAAMHSIRKRNLSNSYSVQHVFIIIWNYFYVLHGCCMAMWIRLHLNIGSGGYRVIRTETYI